MAESVSRVVAAAVLGAAVAVGGLWVGQGLEGFRTGDRSVTIKGLAEQAVPADFALWSLTFKRAGNEFGGVQKALASDRERVMAFLQQRGFTDAEIEVRPLQVEDNFVRDFSPGQQPLRFTGSGTLIVRTARIDAVAEAALAIDPLTQDGVQIDSASGGPSYHLRGFNDLKAPLLAQATANAKEQAAKFAAEAGAELGALRRANQGVIQITGDDGGDYDDGSSRTKRLRVVSTFDFMLR